MSIVLAKSFVYQQVSLQSLRDKVVAIDILPWLYKYLFTLSKDHTPLSFEQVYTGPLKGFLYFIKNLRIWGVTPIICIDDTPPIIKKLEIKKRLDQRIKTLSKYQLLESSGIELSDQEKKKKSNASSHIGPLEKKLIIDCCRYLGIAYYSAPGVEGQKACTFLKLNGLADECMTLDRDALMYGTSFYGAADFKQKTIRYYDYTQNLISLQLYSHDQLLKTIICTGSDYGKGLNKVGPIVMKKLLRQEKVLLERISKQIPNYQQIYQTLISPISIFYLKKEEPNPVYFVQFLKDLKFRSSYITGLCTYLF